MKGKPLGRGWLSELRKEVLANLFLIPGDQVWKIQDHRFSVSWT